MNHYIIIKTLLLYIHNIIISLNFTNYKKFIKKKKENISSKYSNLLKRRKKKIP